MTDLLERVYIYNGSEVDNNYANYLIDEIYLRQNLIPLNRELEPKPKRRVFRARNFNEIVNTLLKTVKKEING